MRPELKQMIIYFKNSENVSEKKQFYVKFDALNGFKEKMIKCLSFEKYFP